MAKQLAKSDFSKELHGPRRLISLGYYDGTIHGLVKFEATGAAFRYDLISWDSGEDWRVFCLAQMAPNDFEEAERMLSVLGDPKWPCWYPTWEFHSDAQKQETEKALEIILDRCGPYVAAVLSTDLCTSIKAQIEIGADLRDAVEEFGRTRQIQVFERWLEAFGPDTLVPT